MKYQAEQLRLLVEICTYLLDTEGTPYTPLQIKTTLDYLWCRFEQYEHSWLVNHVDNCIRDEYVQVYYNNYTYVEIFQNNLLLDSSWTEMFDFL